MRRAGDTELNKRKGKQYVQCVCTSMKIKQFKQPVVDRAQIFWWNMTSTGWLRLNRCLVQFWGLEFLTWQKVNTPVLYMCWWFVVTDDEGLEDAEWNVVKLPDVTTASPGGEIAEPDFLFHTGDCPVQPGWKSQPVVVSLYNSAPLWTVWVYQTVHVHTHHHHTCHIPNVLNLFLLWFLLTHFRLYNLIVNILFVVVLSMFKLVWSYLNYFKGPVYQI